MIKMPIIGRNTNGFKKFTVGNLQVMTDGNKSYVGFIPLHNEDDTIYAPLCVRELLYGIDPKKLYAYLMPGQKPVIKMVYIGKFTIEAAYSDESDMDMNDQTIHFRYYSMLSGRGINWINCIDAQGRSIFIDGDEVYHFNKDTKEWVK